MLYISDTNEYFSKVGSPLSVIITVNDDKNQIVHMNDALFEQISNILSSNSDARSYWRASSKILESLLNYNQDVHISLHLLDVNYNLFLLYLFMMCTDEVDNSTDLIEFANHIYINDAANIIQLSSFTSNDKSLCRIHELILSDTDQKPVFSNICKLLRKKITDGKSVEFAINNLHLHNAYNTLTMHYLQVLNDNARNGEKQYMYFGDNVNEINQVIQKYISNGIEFKICADNHRMNTYVNFFSTLAAKLYYSVYENQFITELMGETFYKFWQLVDTSKVMMIDVGYMLRIQNALSESKIE